MNNKFNPRQRPYYNQGRFNNRFHRPQYNRFDNPRTNDNSWKRYEQPSHEYNSNRGRRVPYYNSSKQDFDQNPRRYNEETDKYDNIHSQSSSNYNARTPVREHSNQDGADWRSKTDEEQQHAEEKRETKKVGATDLKSAIELSKRTQDMLSKLGWFNNADLSDANAEPYHSETDKRDCDMDYAEPVVNQRAEQRTERASSEYKRSPDFEPRRFPEPVETRATDQRRGRSGNVCQEEGTMESMESIFRESTLQKINEIYDQLKMEEVPRKQVVEKYDDSVYQKERKGRQRFSDVLEKEKEPENDAYSNHLTMLLKSIGYDNLPNITLPKSKGDSSQEQSQNSITGVVIDYSHGPTDHTSSSQDYKKERPFKRPSEEEMETRKNLDRLLSEAYCEKKLTKHKAQDTSAKHLDSFNDFEAIQMTVFQDEAVKDDRTDNIWNKALSAAVSPGTTKEKKIVRRVKVLKRNRSSSVEETHSDKRKQTRRMRAESPSNVSYDGANRKARAKRSSSRSKSRSKSNNRNRFKRFDSRPRLEKERRSQSRERRRANNLVGSRFRSDDPKYSSRRYKPLIFRNNAPDRGKIERRLHKLKDGKDEEFNMSPEKVVDRLSDSEEYDPEKNDKETLFDKKRRFLERELKLLRLRRQEIERKPFHQASIKSKVIRRIDDKINMIEYKVKRMMDIKKPKIDFIDLDKSEINYPSINSDIEAEAKVTKTETKPKLKKMEFEYFDAGSHWCSTCNATAATFEDYCQHLHSDYHYKLSIVGKSRSPIKEVSTKKYKNSVVLPMKGVEFMVPNQSFCCELCKETFKDKHEAFEHLIGELHNKNYMDYVQENVNYEKQQQLLRELKQPYALSMLNILPTSQNTVDTSTESKINTDVVATVEVIKPAPKEQKDKTVKTGGLPFIGKFPKYRTTAKDKVSSTKKELSGIVIAAGCLTADEASRYEAVSVEDVKKDDFYLDAKLPKERIGEEAKKDDLILDIELPKVTKGETISDKDAKNDFLKLNIELPKETMGEAISDKDAKKDDLILNIELPKEIPTLDIKLPDENNITGVQNKKKVDAKVKTENKKASTIEDIANEVSTTASSLSQIAANYANMQQNAFATPYPQVAFAPPSYASPWQQYTGGQGYHPFNAFQGYTTWDDQYYQMFPHLKSAPPVNYVAADDVLTGDAGVAVVEDSGLDSEVCNEQNMVVASAEQPLDNVDLKIGDDEAMVFDGNLEDVEPVLEETAVDGKLEDVEQVLDEAAVNGKLEDVEPVLEETAVDGKLEDVEQVLDEAAVNGKLEDVESVLEETALNEKLEDVKPVLDKAANDGKLEDVKPVLDETAVNGKLEDVKPILDEAVVDGKLEDVEPVLDKAENLDDGKNNLSNSKMEISDEDTDVENSQLFPNDIAQDDINSTDNISNIVESNSSNVRLDITPVETEVVKDTSGSIQIGASSSDDCQNNKIAVFDFSEADVNPIQDLTNEPRDKMDELEENEAEVSVIRDDILRITNHAEDEASELDQVDNVAEATIDSNAEIILETERDILQQKSVDDKTKTEKAFDVTLQLLDNTDRNNGVSDVLSSCSNNIKEKDVSSTNLIPVTTNSDDELAIVLSVSNQNKIKIVEANSLQTVDEKIEDCHQDSLYNEPDPIKTVIESPVELLEICQRPLRSIIDSDVLQVEKVDSSPSQSVLLELEEEDSSLSQRCADLEEALEIERAIKDIADLANSFLIGKDNENASSVKRNVGSSNVKKPKLFGTVSENISCDSTEIKSSDALLVVDEHSSKHASSTIISSSEASSGLADEETNLRGLNANLVHELQGDNSSSSTVDLDDSDYVESVGSRSLAADLADVTFSGAFLSDASDKNIDDSISTIDNDDSLAIFDTTPVDSSENGVVISTTVPEMNPKKTATVRSFKAKKGKKLINIKKSSK